VTAACRGRLLRLTVTVTSVLILVGEGVASAEDPLFAAMRVMHVSGEIPAPAFALPTPDGRTIDLAGLGGKVVLLNFWATWCTPCREEMPSMERLHQEFKGQGLVVLAVNVQESPKRAALFMRGFQLSFPTVLDADTTVTARYQVRGLPATFLIDQRGRLVGQVIGARDWAGPPARALVRAILAGSGRPTASAPGR